MLRQRYTFFWLFFGSLTQNRGKIRPIYFLFVHDSRCAPRAWGFSSGSSFSISPNK